MVHVHTATKCGSRVTGGGRNLLSMVPQGIDARRDVNAEDSFNPFPLLLLLLLLLVPLLLLVNVVRASRNIEREALTPKKENRLCHFYAATTSGKEARK